MKLLHVVGARPQFMKLAPLLNELKKTNIDSKILHTGQHFDMNMSDIFFEDMGIKKPDYNLNLASSSVGKMLDEITRILSENKFDSVLVYGDTNSTLAGAISARQLGLQVIHYEAGVRNKDPKMPEEINRILVDSISDILLCVSNSSKMNLEKEKCWYGSKIFVTGDLMYDSFLKYKTKKINQDNYIYVTIHRANNTDNKKTLKNIIDALSEINKTKEIIFPIHPRTKKMIEQYAIKYDFNTIEPVGYKENIKLIQGSDFVITDSGGVVRESYWANKKSILLVNKPLWPELVDLNSCINIDSNYETIIDSVSKIIELNPIFDTDIYGDGNSAKKIRDILC
tara:strand:+ start:2326 stop:3345 length:1020 start_codon:yes stop_codon:yes gene_type:complete